MTKDKTHAKLSASGSSKWLNCPGSIEAEEAFFKEEERLYNEALKRGETPKIKENPYAELGTLAHELADLCLKNNQDAVDYLDKEIHCDYNDKLIKITVDKDMVKFVQEYLDYVLSHETSTSKLFTEEKVDFSNIVPEGFGTLDSAILDYNTGICHIFDLKYGEGVLVEAENNTQAQLYALGLYNELQFLEVIKSFKIHIVQPRKYSISSWEISIEDLINFGIFASNRAHKALSPNAERIPGEKQCQWCEVRHSCIALMKFTEEVIGDEFENLDNNILDYCTDNTKNLLIGNENDALSQKELYHYLSNKQIKLILDNKKLITKFLKDVEEDTLERLLEGEKIEGYKLVRKKSTRKWTDEAEEFLVSKLEDKAYNKKLIGLTESKKVLTKDEIELYTYKSKGGIELAPDTDKREDIIDITEQFEELK